MIKASGSRSTCSYVNAAATDDVTVTTATMTSRKTADKAVAGAARTAKANVRYLHGVGDSAVAYLTMTTTRSTATCLFAKNGRFVFLVIGSPHARLLMHDVISLAKTAAARTS